MLPGEPGAETPLPGIDPRLAAELESPPWIASWELTPTVHTPSADPAARQRWWTLAEMLRPHARDAFVMSDDPRALDMRCGEGWMAQRMLSWGARHVRALDNRERAARRAMLLRDHYAIPAAELEVREREEATSEPAESFDVVVLFDACELLSDPAPLKAARARCRGIFAFECYGSETVFVAEAALKAGFAEIDRPLPPPGADRAYVLERRDVLIARVRPL